MSDQPPDPYGYAPPPRPGVVPLAPLDLGGVIGGAFATWGRYWRIVLPMSVAASLVLAVVGIPLDRFTFPATSGPGTSAQQPSFEGLGAAVGTVFALLVINLLAWAVVTGVIGGVLMVLGHRATLGHPATWSPTWQRVRPMVGRLVGLALVINVGAGVGLFFCIVPGVVLYTFWSLAVPAMVTEGLGLGQALGRSYRLVLGDFWRVFGVLLLVSLACLLVALAIGIPLSLPAELAPGDDPASPVGWGPTLLSTLGTLLTGVLTVAAIPLVAWFLYVDQRIRRERYDLQLAQEASTPGTA